MARRRGTLDGLDSETVMSPGSSAAALANEKQLQAVAVGATLLEVYPLPETGDVSIGRHRGSGIAIEDDTISRFHAVLHLGPPHSIEDIGSANGTFVDGVRVQPGTKQPVAIGSVIKLGSIVLVVQKLSEPR